MMVVFNAFATPEIRGSSQRDFTFIDNVVQANLKAAAAPARADGLVYNVACGAAITVKDLCLRIRDLVGAKIDPEHGPTRVGDVRHSLADIDLARDRLDYEPTVSLDEGLESTVRWYQEQQSGGES